MSRAQVLKELSGLILAAKQAGPLRVGIDGIDAAGKTSLANELATHLSQAGCDVICASIDGFHNPKQIRYQRGQSSPQGYYYDSFNYELIRECLLKPLGPGGSRKYRPKAFDFKTDSEIIVEETSAVENQVLLFEGVFLFRPELYPYWDFKIFVEIDFQTSLARALRRDQDLFGDSQTIIKRYQEKYILGQQIYLEAVQPKSKADVIIDNHDLIHPHLIVRKDEINDPRRNL
jgi:uridine kinase